MGVGTGTTGTVIYGDGWEWEQLFAGWMGTGTISTSRGIGVEMGITVVGTVGDGYKYLSPCSCLILSPLDGGGRRACKTRLELKTVVGGTTVLLLSWTVKSSI